MLKISTTINIKQNKPIFIHFTKYCYNVIKTKRNILFPFCIIFIEKYYGGINQNANYFLQNY